MLAARPRAIANSLPVNKVTSRPMRPISLAVLAVEEQDCP